MPMYWEESHRETAAGFDIVLSVAPEDMPPDWDVTEEELSKIENGTLAYFIARVEARKEGITLGTAYLGGCVALVNTIGPADARLIAAAPAMLEALLDALPYVEDVLSDPAALACFKPGTVQRHAQAIRDAISVATEG